MDQVSIKKINLKDFLKDILSFTLAYSGLNFCKGHFKGHFVPYRSNAFVASFLWTLQKSKAVNSYLTFKLHKAVRRPIFSCKSTDSLFDGHLIVVRWALLILNQ